MNSKLVHISLHNMSCFFFRDSSPDPEHSNSKALSLSDLGSLKCKLSLMQRYVDLAALILTFLSYRNHPGPTKIL